MNLSGIFDVLVPTPYKFIRSSFTCTGPQTGSQIPLGEPCSQTHRILGRDVEKSATYIAPFTLWPGINTQADFLIILGSSCIDSHMKSAENNLPANLSMIFAKITVMA